MLKELLGTLMLVTSIGGGSMERTTANFKLEPTKQETSHTTTINITNLDYTKVNEYTQYEDTYYGIYKTKYSLSKYDATKGNVIGSFYKTDYGYFEDGNMGQGRTEQDTNQSLYIMQITPYVPVENTSANISIEFEMYVDHPYNQVYGGQYIFNYAITTTDVSGLINMQNWTGTNYNWDVEALLGSNWSQHQNTILFNDDTQNVETYTLSYNGEYETIYVIVLIEQYMYFMWDGNIGLSNPPSEGWLELNLPTATLGFSYTDTVVYEVIDLPGMLLSIVTMPFTFISTAFNLTIFPGTPYQVNLSNLFMTIFAVLVFTFLLKVILGK